MGFYSERLASQIAGFTGSMAFIQLFDCFEDNHYSDEGCGCVSVWLAGSYLYNSDILLLQRIPSCDGRREMLLTLSNLWSPKKEKRDQGGRIYYPAWLVGQTGMAPSAVCLVHTELLQCCLEMELFSNGKIKTNAGLFQVCLSSCMFFCSEPNLKPCSAKAHFSCHQGKNRLW